MILAPQSMDLVGDLYSDFAFQREQKRQQRKDAYSNQYPIPPDWTMRLNGTLSNQPYEMQLKFFVYYRAKVDKSGCRSYSLMVGREPDLKYHTYEAKIVDQQYQLDLPLNMYPAYKGCHYQVDHVGLELSKKGSKANTTIELFNDSGLDLDHQSQQLSILCYLPWVDSSELTYTYWGCTEAGDTQNLGEPFVAKKLRASRDKSLLNYQVNLNFLPEQISNTRQR